MNCPPSRSSLAPLYETVNAFPNQQLYPTPPPPQQQQQQPEVVWQLQQPPIASTAQVHIILLIMCPEWPLTTNPYVPIFKPKVDVEALYQRPKKQRRQQQQHQNRVEKIEEEEPEVKCDRREDNGDSNKVNCGDPATTATGRAPEGAAAAATRQQRLAPLAEQVQICRKLRVLGCLTHVRARA